jgi:hypothetical protein
MEKKSEYVKQKHHTIHGMYGMVQKKAAGKNFSRQLIKSRQLTRANAT